MMTSATSWHDAADTRAGRGVLVVEDEPHVLSGLLEVLRRAGWRATGARTFEDGKRLLSESPPALLITDIRLGSFNGLQLAIYGRLRHPGMGLMIMTGFPDPTVEAQARQFGAEYLVKPIAPDQLRTLVSTRLGGISDRSE